MLESDKDLIDEQATEIDRLRAALKPFAAIAGLVNHTDVRDGECVFRLPNPDGRYYTLVRDDFRRAAEAHEQGGSTPSLPGKCVDGEPNTCTQPFNWDDGVPYCDTCGLYRDTIAQNARKRRT